MMSCPDHETLLMPEMREAVLDHAADCSLCRRHIELLSLQEQPERKTIAWWPMVAAAAVLMLIILAGRRTEEPTPEPVITVRKPQPIQAPPAIVVEDVDEEPEPAPVPEPKPAPKPEPDVKPEKKTEPVKAPEPEPEPVPAIVRKEPEPKPTPKPKPSVREPVAILAPFGKLRAGELAMNMAATVKPTDLLSADRKPAGFHLTENAHVILGAKSSIRAYHSPEHLLPVLELAKGQVALDSGDFPFRIRIRTGEERFRLEFRGRVVVDAETVTPIRGEVICARSGGHIDRFRAGESFRVADGRVSKRSASQLARLDRAFRCIVPRPLFQSARSVTSKNGEAVIALGRTVKLDRPVTVRIRYTTDAKRFAVTASMGRPGGMDVVGVRVDKSGVVEVQISTADNYEMSVLRVMVPAKNTITVERVEILRSKR